MDDFSAYENQRVLVLGGAGFIGSNLVRTLVDFDAEVTVIDSLFSKHGGNLFNLQGYLEKINFINDDINNLEITKAAVDRQQFIFNLAGQTSHVDSMEDPFTDLKVNVASRLSVLEACKSKNKKARIVYTSTRQIYGRPNYLPVKENHPLTPVDVNGVNEIAAEHFHMLYRKVYHLPVTIVRLTNVYGPRMRIKDTRQNFIGWWFRQLIEGKPIQIYGDGQQLRDLLYVDDVVDAILRIGLRPVSIGEIMNLGTSPISLLDLAKAMIQIKEGGGYKLVPFPDERKVIDIGSYYGDYTKAKNLLNWVPMIDLQSGLKQTFEYFDQYWGKYL
jgi:UDP-glucose 4-epimerase